MVLAIVAIMMAIILGSLPNFRDHVSLDLTAQQVATVVREGQIYGMSKLGTDEATAGPLGKLWGLRFSSKDGESNRFITFIYQEGLMDEDTITNPSDSRDIQNVYTLGGGIKIKEIWMNESTTRTLQDFVDLKFQARYPEPKCFSRWKDLSYGCDDLYESVDLVLYSPRENRTRTVRVSINGQISVLPATQNNVQ